MSGIAAMLADVGDIEDLLRQNHALQSELKETILIFGILLAVIGGIFCWAAFIRKKPHEHRHHHWMDGGDEDATKRDGAQSGRGGHRRRRKEDPCNPTLAETRGLPPVRDNDKPGAGL